MKPIAALILLICFFLSTDVYAENIECPGEQQAQSIRGDHATTIRFINRQLLDVYVYWIDYGGNRQFFARIPPSGIYAVDTFITHPWVITNETADCLAIYYPDGQSRTIEIYPCGIGSVNCR